MYSDREKLEALELFLLAAEAYRMQVIIVKGREAPILKKLDDNQPIIRSIADELIKNIKG